MQLNNTIIIRSPFILRSGYETLIETICLELSKNNYVVYPLSTNGEITNPFLKQLIKPITPQLTKYQELCILPIQADLNDYNINNRIPRIGKRVFFTMWESTQLSMNAVSLLNTGIGVIVPNEWNKQNFKIDGVTVPIKKCPLFVDTTFFKYKPHIENGYFTFGTGNADLRKRLNDVIRCFCKAFSPSIKDVKLKIKIDNVDSSLLTRFSDDRLELNVKKLSKQELADWYHSINVFVSGSSAEGWGLMQHEAMACGRPLIATEYAGLAEFFDTTVGFPVDYKEVFSEWSWGYSNGFWSKFNEDDMIDKLRYCYNNPNKVINYGKKSSIKASKFNVERFVKKLIGILKDFQT